MELINDLVSEYDKYNSIIESKIKALENKGLYIVTKGDSNSYNPYTGYLSDKSKYICIFTNRYNAGTFSAIQNRIRGYIYRLRDSDWHRMNYTEINNLILNKKIPIFDTLFDAIVHYYDKFYATYKPVNTNIASTGDLIDNVESIESSEKCDNFMTIYRNDEYWKMISIDFDGRGGGGFRQFYEQIPVEKLNAEKLHEAGVTFDGFQLKN